MSDFTPQDTQISIRTYIVQSEKSFDDDRLQSGRGTDISAYYENNSHGQLEHEHNQEMESILSDDSTQGMNVSSFKNDNETTALQAQWIIRWAARIQKQCHLPPNSKKELSTFMFQIQQDHHFDEFHLLLWLASVNDWIEKQKATDEETQNAQVLSNGYHNVNQISLDSKQGELERPIDWCKELLEFMADTATHLQGYLHITPQLSLQNAMDSEQDQKTQANYTMEDQLCDKPSWRQLNEAYKASMLIDIRFPTSRTHHLDKETLNKDIDALCEKDLRIQPLTKRKRRPPQLRSPPQVELDNADNGHCPNEEDRKPKPKHTGRPMPKPRTPRTPRNPKITEEQPIYQEPNDLKEQPRVQPDDVPPSIYLTRPFDLPSGWPILPCEGGDRTYTGASNSSFERNEQQAVDSGENWVNIYNSLRMDLGLLQGNYPQGGFERDGSHQQHYLSQSLQGWPIFVPVTMFPTQAWSQPLRQNEPGLDRRQPPFLPKLVIDRNYMDQMDIVPSSGSAGRLCTLAFPTHFVGQQTGMPVLAGITRSNTNESLFHGLPSGNQDAFVTSNQPHFDYFSVWPTSENPLITQTYNTPGTRENRQ